jgi:hypothetical protein
MAIIFGSAWWAIFKGEPFAKGLGITASVIFILLPLSEFLYFSRPIWSSLGVMLATGIAGLVIFLWRDKHGPSERPGESADYGPAGPNEAPSPEQTTP